jgi:hypothetical protein
MPKKNKLKVYILKTKQGAVVWDGFGLMLHLSICVSLMVFKNERQIINLKFTCYWTSWPVEKFQVSLGLIHYLSESDTWPYKRGTTVLHILHK